MTLISLVVSMTTIIPNGFLDLSLNYRQTKIKLHVCTNITWISLWRPNASHEVIAFICTWLFSSNFPLDLCVDGAGRKRCVPFIESVCAYNVLASCKGIMYSIILLWVLLNLKFMEHEKCGQILQNNTNLIKAWLCRASRAQIGGSGCHLSGWIRWWPSVINGNSTMRTCLMFPRI